VANSFLVLRQSFDSRECLKGDRGRALTLRTVCDLVCPVLEPARGDWRTRSTISLYEHAHVGFLSFNARSFASSGITSLVFLSLSSKTSPSSDLPLVGVSIMEAVGDYNSR